MEHYEGRKASARLQFYLQASYRVLQDWQGNDQGMKPIGYLRGILPVDSVRDMRNEGNRCAWPAGGEWSGHCQSTGSSIVDSVRWLPETGVPMCRCPHRRLFLEMAILNHHCVSTGLVPAARV